MHQLLDRRLPPEADSELLAHAHNCGACRDELEAQQALLDALDMLESPPMSAGFAERAVAQHVQHRRSARQAGLRRASYSLAALAAGLLLLLTAAPRLFDRDGARSRGSVVHDEPQSAVLHQAGVPGTVSTPQVATSESGTSPSRSLASDSSASDGKPPSPLGMYSSDLAMPYLLSALEQEQNGLMLAQNESDRYFVMLEDWGSRLVEMPKEPIEVESIPGGLKPLADSFGVAFDLLRQTMAVNKTPPSQPQALFTLRRFNVA